MKKILYIFSLSAFFFSCQNQAQNQQKVANVNQTTMSKQNIYQFKVEDLEGNTFDFSTLKGKIILVVNTASECGLTPQYEQLQAIYEKYRDKNFVIVGFPANNFGSQRRELISKLLLFVKKIMGLLFQ